MTTKQTFPFLTGSRIEIDDEPMQVIEGAIPDDISGFVYIVCQMGNVNSNGLPFKKHEPNGEPNPDFQSPIMNGDGFVYKLNFSNQKKVNISSRIMKPPSYYADLATGFDGPAHKDPRFEGFHFKNLGISRLSFKLGSRNFLNTAFLPVHFKTDSTPSLLVTDDVARPFKLNAKTMELDTAIGENSDWKSSMPPKLKFPFPLTETTAHPSWDPITKEFFSFNFSKSTYTQLHVNFVAKFLFSGNRNIAAKLKAIAKNYEHHGSEKKAIKEIKDMLKKHERSENIIIRILQVLFGFLKTIFGPIFRLISKILGLSTPDRVFLMKSVDGVNFAKWRVLNQKGKDLAINQCMHQTMITKNYIVFVDASFKFALELLFNNPFPRHPDIEKFIRTVTAKTMLPFTNLWYIKRADINKNKKTVVAFQLDEPLPYECIHFAADYEDGDGINLFTIHNNSVCMAEWLRPYDISFFTQKPIPDHLVSYFAVCPMAVGRTARFVIDPTRNTFSSKIILKEPGNLPKVEELNEKGIDQTIGANTWGLGMLVYKDQYSPTKVVNKIKTLYYLSLGAIPETLSQFIFDLYKDYPWREMELDEMLAYIKQTVPQSLFSVDASTMKIKDSWVFAKNEHLCSIQYVNSDNEIEREDKGYILVSVKVGTGITLEGEFTSEIWLFKANNLKKGPVCKLTNAKFVFASTLHSCWLDEDYNVVSGEKIDVREDYSAYIKAVFAKEEEKKETMLAFFEEFVFPHF